ncbi:MAG: hypothetical protein JXM69_01445 [Anaerolineae bacterium]|nr:hypothetical protein [Anaerolineae bacterium]
MTWLPLLLADPSPALRLLVLRELFNRPEDDAEVRELAALRETDPLVTDLLVLQEPEGAWSRVDLTSSGRKLRATALALTRLGYLGFGPDHPAVQGGAEYLFSLQQADGSWPLATAWTGPEAKKEGYDMVPLQTALPLRGLAACGYATDARAERAYEWLLAQRLPDGAWPTGLAAGNYGYVGGYRRLAHSRWGCRSNTTGALMCLACHPERRTSPEAQRALDLLLGREIRESYSFGFEVARTIGVEPARGFFTHYARFDLAQILDLCWRAGAGRDDERVIELVTFVQDLQGPYGLWEYTPRPQASRWVAFDLLRSLSRLGEAGDWLSLEPRTPFQAYPRRTKRF